MNVFALLLSFSSLAVGIFGGWLLRGEREEYRSEIRRAHRMNARRTEFYR